MYEYLVYQPLDLLSVGIIIIVITSGTTVLYQGGCWRNYVSAVVLCLTTHIPEERYSHDPYSRGKILTAPGPGGIFAILIWSAHLHPFPSQLVDLVFPSQAT